MNKLKLLKKLEFHNNKDSRLEQYFTPPELALKFLKRIDFKDKVIIDLGSGNGILGLTALLLGAKKVIFAELDSAAINISKRNYENLRKHCKGEAEFFNKDVALLFKSELTKIDIAILNPPFGTTKKSKKIDTVFLKKAMKLSNKILTMHKTASKEFIEDLFKKNDYSILYEKDFLFPIKKSYEHHEKDNFNVEVTLFIAEKLV